MERTSYVRALLDDKMGVNRDGDMAQYEIKTYEDSRVCKPYLLGLCVHDQFFNTTLDQGACSREGCGEAANKFRKQYLGDRGSAPDRSAYVMEQRAMLEQFLRDVDRGIQRNQRRVETAQGYRPEAVDLESRPEVLELTAQIDKAMADSEAAGEEGRVDEAEALLADAERLRGSKLSLQRRLLAEVGGGSRGGLVGNSHLLQVCNACGAMLSERDSDDRLREHFEGRMHLGVVRVRERMAELRGERRPALPARAGPQTASASRGPAAPAAAADRGPPPATLGRGPAEPAATA